MELASQPTMAPIAIVGIGALFPGSDGMSGFWRDVVTGRDLIQEVPASHWLREDYFDPRPGDRDKVYSSRGAFLDPVDFDPLEFAVPPRVVPTTDTAQLLSLVVAKRLWSELMASSPREVDRGRVAVILGGSPSELSVEMGARLQRPVWTKALRESGLPEDQVQAICDRIAASYVPWTETTFPGMLTNLTAGRIANRLDLGGTNCVLDAACASSLAAVDVAVMELRLGLADLVLTGGVDALNDVFMFMCFSKTGALSASGDARPFAADADGTVLGEGIGLLALRRLADAERDGNPIYAVLRGVGSSSDGQARSIYAPRAEGQVLALRRAYAAAGYGPDSVELIEGHGTGTRAGDQAEFQALRQVFSGAAPTGPVRPWCALGSIKSQLGHTKAAAGAAGLIKAALALHAGVLPPTIKVAAPNPDLDLPRSPFYLNTQARPWIHGADSPRRAGVSAFGFGGTNFHVTLEEYRGSGQRAPRVRALAAELVLLAAADADALAAQADGLAIEVAGRGTAGREAALAWLGAVARRSQDAFAAASTREGRARSRLAVVAATPEDLTAKLREAAVRIRQAGPDGFSAADQGLYCGHGGADAGSLALLFPGQGSQYPNMGADLAMAFPAARAVWDASADLPLAAEARLHEVVFPQPPFTEADRQAQMGRLTRTEWAQPAIGAASLAALEILRACGVRPSHLAGHSFGELTALCAAGAMEPADLLRAGRRRGELMAEAASGAGEPGAMTSVFHPAASAQALLADIGDGIAVANFNAPEQVVLSGRASAIAQAEERLRGAGVRFQRLPVGTAFHSPLVRPAAEAFAVYLAGLALRPPRLPVVAGRDGEVYPSDPDVVRARLAAQIAEPVRFVDQIEMLYGAGVRTFVEVGPGAVLAGLVERTLAGRAHLALSLDRRGQDGVTALWHALGRLAVAGVPLNLAGLWAGHGEAMDVAMPAHPSPRRLSLNIAGINYGRPYPPAGGAAALPGPNPAGATAANGGNRDMAQAPGTVGPVAAGRADHGRSPASSAGADLHAVSGWAAAPPWNEPVASPRAADGAGPVPAAPATVPLGGGHAASGTAPERAVAQGRGPAGNEGVPPHPSTAVAVDPSHGHAGSGGAADGAGAFGYGPAGNGRVPPRPPIPGTANGAAVHARPGAAPEPMVALAAFQAMAEQAAAAQEAFQRVLSESHGLFLRAAEASAAALAVALGGGVVDARPDTRVPEPLPPVASGPSLEVVPPPHAELVSAVVPPLAGAVPGVVAPVPPAPALPAAAPALPPPPLRRQAASDPRGILLDVVADKTGYPPEMLDLDLDLESGLGIDSIKRVEILAALQERIPDLPAVEPAEMAALSTLRQILELAARHAPAATDASRAEPLPGPPAAQSPQPAAAAPALPPPPLRRQATSDPRGILLDVVADKTGYPPEMLDLDLDLESGLGIDSIKRVEILAALQERIPDLPAVEPAEMAALSTLRQILDYAARQTQPSAAPAGSTAPAGSAASTAPVASFAASAAPAASAASAHPTASAAPAASAASTASAAPAGSAASTAPVASLAPTALSERFVVEAVAAPPAGFSLPGLRPGAEVVLLGDGGTGIGQALADGLAHAGVRPRLAAEPQAGADAVVMLHGLRAGAGMAAAEQANRDAFAAARAVAARMAEHGGLLVTVQDTGGDFGLSGRAGDRAWAAGLAALAKTAAREWPGAAVKAIDVACAGRAPAEVGAILADELLAGGPELEVGLPADGSRLTLVARPAELGPSSSPPLPPGAVVLATGGARGVTAACLLALAAAAPTPRIAILGRSDLAAEAPEIAAAPDVAALQDVLRRSTHEPLTPAELGRRVQRVLAGREARANLEAMRRAGAEVMYLPTDVRDPAAVAAAADRVRQAWGPIGAIVHGAGVIADRPIATKGDEQFERVFQTKVAGLQALLAATSRDPLGLICLFSSTSARGGNAGQADYAMANEVLNRVAAAEARRRGGACRVKAIGWGPWEGGMVTPLLQRHFAARGIPLLALDEGARRFVAELGASDAAVEVLIGGPGTAAAMLAAAARPLEFEIPVSAATHPHLADHRIRDVPVLPVVLAMEWFARAAAACCPELPLAAIEDVQVLRGVQLPDFAGRGHRLRLRLRPEAARDATRVGLELLGEDGRPCYSATAVLGGARPAPAAPDPGDPPDPWPWPVAALYPDLLFHGPSFRVLRALGGASPAGGTALVAGTAWPGGPWRTDPARLDGGLQLARLWGIRALGGPTLPTRIGAYVPHRATRPDGPPARCMLRARAEGPHRTVSDILFLDVHGQVVAELRGVEQTREPEARP